MLMRPLHLSMRLIALATLIGTLETVGFSNAFAQPCLGLSGRGAPAYNASAQLTRFPSATAVTIRGGGATRRAFVGIHGTLSTFRDNAQSEAMAAGLDGGLKFTLGRNAKIQLCPMLDWTHQVGPNTRRLIPLDYRFNIWTPSIALAREFYENEEVALLPFVAIASQTVKTRTKGRDESRNGVSGERILSAGMGVQFRNTLLMRASLQHALSVRGARPAYALTFGYLFGPPQKQPGN